MRLRLLSCALTAAVVTFASRAALSDVSEPVAVQVEHFSVSGKGDAELAEQLSDAVRRGLAATGRFTVVRPDLAADIQAAQKRFLREIYDANTAPEPGNLKAARLLLKGRLERRPDGGLRVHLTGVDLSTGEQKRELSTILEVSAADLGMLTSEVAAKITLQVAAAVGVPLDPETTQLLERSLAKAKSAEANTRLDLARFLTRRFVYADLIEAERLLLEAHQLDESSLAVRIELAEVEALLALLGVFEGEAPEAYYRRIRAGLKLAVETWKLEPHSAPNLLAILRLAYFANRTDLIELILEASKKYAPGHPFIVLIEGLRETQTERRLAKLEKTVSLDPTSIEARIHLAEAYSSAGRPVNARAQYLFVLERIEPDHPLALALLSGAEYQRARFTSARDLAARAIKVAPNNVWARRNLALAQAVTRKDPEKDLRLALEGNPELVLTIIPAQNEVNRTANRTFREALGDLRRRWPNHAFLRIEMARTLLESGVASDVAEARNLLAIKSKLGKFTEIYRSDLERQALQLQGAHAEAAAVLRRMLELPGIGPRLRDYLSLSLGQLLLQSESTLGEARGVLRRLVDEGTSDRVRSSAATQLATAYVRADEPDTALGWLDRADKLLEGQPVVSFLRGRVLEIKGDVGGAAEAYSQTLDREPNHANAMKQLGQMLVKSGRVEVGLKTLRRAADLNPQALSSFVELSVKHAGLAKTRAEVEALVAAHFNVADYLDAKAELALTAKDLPVAVNALVDAYNIEPTWPRLQVAVRALAMAGRSAEARQLVGGARTLKLAPAPEYEALLATLP